MKTTHIVRFLLAAAFVLALSLSTPVQQSVSKVTGHSATVSAQSCDWCQDTEDFGGGNCNVVSGCNLDNACYWEGQICYARTICSSGYCCAGAWNCGAGGRCPYAYCA